MADRQAGHVQHVMLADADDNFAPPEKPVLLVSEVSDVVFLDLAELDETATTWTLNVQRRIGVKRQALMDALDIVHRDGRAP